MSNEKCGFKPGEMAVVIASGEERHAYRGVDGWTFAHPYSRAHDGLAISVVRDVQCRIRAVRRLVVIDPEDREQVERMMRAAFPLAIFPAATDDMQAALREIANPNPPRPAEPMQLGALAEDEAGRIWVRADSNSGHPWFASIDGDPCWGHWGQIKVARVLSEGVSR